MRKITMNMERKKGIIFRMLEDEEIERIHLSTLDLLEQVGIYSESERILEIFANGGAEVNYNKRIIKIPRVLVEESIKKAPKHIKLFGRNSKYELLIEDHKVHFGMGGTPVPYVRDIETGEFRHSTKKDVEEAARLGDALPNMAFIMSVAAALDVPSKAQYEHEWEALLSNTQKPILYVAPSANTAKNVLKMLALVTGSIEELEKRPIAGLYVDLESPLFFPKHNENIIEFAKVGVPIALGAAAHAGLTAPVTISGALVMSNAMNLAAITLTQLINPGTPVVYAAEVNVGDPWTMKIAYGDPERALTTSVINAQLADYYGLPTFGYAGCTDSKLLDAQAGAEVMMHILMSALSGINLVHDCGYIASGNAGSLEMVVICDEAISMVSRIVRGIDVNDETLALEVMQEVGPKGSFLSHEHTVRYIRKEIFIPSLFDRSSIDEWTKGGKKGIGDIAKERVKKILREHHPEPMPKETKLKIEEIIKKAERD